MLEAPFPVIEDPAVVRTEVATAAAAVLDITAANLTDLALAKFGPWREDTKKAKAEFTALVLDLKTQSAIDEAVSLRNRKIKQPLADARKTAQALKSKLTAVSKAVGDELPLIEAAWADAAGAITPRIEAAQKVLDDAKAEAARIEAERLAELARIEREAQERHAARLQAIGGYLARCQEPGMTAERIQRDMDLLAESDVSDIDAARAEALAGAKARALESMRVLHAQTLGREQEEERQKRIAEENRLQAEANAREAARIAAEAEELRRRAAELQRLEAEAAARAKQDEESSLVASIRTASRRVEWPKNGAYILKAVGTFECMAPNWENDPREAVREAVAEGRRYLAGLMEEAKAVEEEARQREAAAATPAPVMVEVPYVATLVFDTETRVVEGVMSVPALAGASEGTTEGQPAQQVLKAEGESPDATARATAANVSPRGGAMGAGHATAAAPAGEPATLTLGEICNRLDPDGGCRFTAAFLSERLHITASKTGPNGAKLFTEAQFQTICAQLCSHISAMAELYAPETV